MVLLTAACAEKIVPDCPARTKLIDHAEITQFKDGPGRDITDIDFKARMHGPLGQCVFTDEGQLKTISLQVVFEIERGPTTTRPTEDVPYYVAIMTRDQEILMKQSFVASLTYPEGASQMRFIDGVVDIEMPVSDKYKPSMLEIRTGFQLTEEQLNYNRLFSWLVDLSPDDPI